jgi:Tfp pilus assembly protein PilF
MAYEEMRDIQMAIKMFKQALTINEEFTPSLFHLGLMYHANSQLFEAKKCFTKVLKIRSDRRVFESRGLVYQDLLYYDLAVEDFTAAIHCEPNYPLNFFYRGKSFLYLGRYKEAIDDFNEAFKLGCEDPQVYHARAQAYKFMNNHESAIGDLEYAIKMEGNNVEYLFSRSQCYFDLKEYNRAASDLDEAIR